jgi:helicase
MRVEDVCSKHNLPASVAEVLKKSGIEELYPPQAEAIRRGVLNGKNMVVAIPTAAGKSLIAELAMLKSVLIDRGKCIYIVPLRALASEKYEDFRQKYGELGVRVGISTGDFDAPDPSLARYDILVATSEKVDSLLRHRAKWLADIVTVAVLDEVHLINDPGRGPTLEILTARLRRENPKLQILALSATISNADEIADWLNAEVVTSDWRPVPLKEGVYHRGAVRFSDGSERKIKTGVKDVLAALALDTVQEGGQALIFVSTRRSSQTAAELIGAHIQGILTHQERRELDEVAQRVERALGEPTRICKRLGACIRMGTAFHHAGLYHLQRKFIEDAFRGHLIKVICATPTLAAGVNLPSRRAIVRDYRRYDPMLGQQFIPVLEFRQMAGRAGRPKYDKYGEAILIAKSKDELEALFEAFIFAKPERITSKLASEPALRTHILAAIATGYARSFDGLLDFIGQTFFAHQHEARAVAGIVDRIIDYLDREEMIRRQGELLVATPFGERVSQLYIDPESGVVLRDGIKNISAAPPTELGILHIICHTPDMGLLYLGRREKEELERFALEHIEEFLVKVPDPYEDPEKFEFFLAELKTAKMLQAWIEEADEDEIHEEFGIGAGDIRRAAEVAEWLLYSAHELAKLFKIRRALSPLRKLRQRVRYGIKEELLELVTLSGIGRVRGRDLYRAGYRRIADIRRASVEELKRVPHIGEEIARSIKRQVEQEFEESGEYRNRV